MAEPAPAFSRRSSSAYSAMFSTFAFGAFLVVTGSIGWDIRRLHGFFEGGRWVDGPIWWQVALGLVLLRLGAYLLRRLEPSLAPRAPQKRTVKYVGRGATAGVQHNESRPSLPDGDPKS